MTKVTAVPYTENVCSVVYRAPDPPPSQRLLWLTPEYKIRVLEIVIKLSGFSWPWYPLFDYRRFETSHVADQFFNGFGNHHQRTVYWFDKLLVLHVIEKLDQ